jgi:hypothetical protein
MASWDGEAIECATWLHNAKELPKEGFKGEVERHLTGKRQKLGRFKLYKSQIPVVGKALETDGYAKRLSTETDRKRALSALLKDFDLGSSTKSPVGCGNPRDRSKQFSFSRTVAFAL